MKRFTLLALSALTSISVQAAEDLSLPNALWKARPVAYVCETSPATAVSTPASHASINVAFEDFIADASLENGLVKATFVQNAVSCRYSAIIKANYATRLFELVESRAYAADGSDCTAGQAVLDSTFASDRFTYWGNPRHVTFLVPDATNAAAMCGASASGYGIDFVLTGTL